MKNRYFVLYILFLSTASFVMPTPLYAKRDSSFARLSCALVVCCLLCYQPVQGPPLPEKLVDKITPIESSLFSTNTNLIGSRDLLQIVAPTALSFPPSLEPTKEPSVLVTEFTATMTLQPTKSPTSRLYPPLVDYIVGTLVFISAAFLIALGAYLSYKKRKIPKFNKIEPPTKNATEFVIEL